MPSEDLVNGLKVKADEDYILFSKAEDKFGLGSYVDEYELFAETAQDLNRVYIIWTEAPIMKPSLSENKTSTEAQLPLELPAKKFKVWLSENRRYHTDMQVKRLDITISE